jgi:4-amino-4-deoxy-L-arabinose transferase-like glycosyltransferase
VRLFFSVLIACAVFGLGATLGITDDEAYYWVISQRLDWGYAYHPPMIAWWIAAVRSVFGYFFLEPFGASTQLIRFSSALLNGLWIWVLLGWLKSTSAHPMRGLGVFLCFGALFSVSWMMVPDLPLILGVLISFTACWRLCFAESPLKRDVLYLAFGLLLSLISKISAILFFPGVLLLLIIEVYPKDRRLFKYAFVALVCAGVLGVLPTLWWNAQNDWVALSYQLSERHRGEFSLVRGLRAWAIQLLVAAPALFGAFALMRRWREREAKFFLAWMVPTALLFLLQPLRGEFKPHWLLMAWIFPVLWLSLRSARESSLSLLARAHVGHGLLVFVVFTSAFHFPWITRFFVNSQGPERAALLDVSNDLRGWEDLREHLGNKLSVEDQALPWVGTRYQTASQAAFALADPTRVILLPQHRRDQKEWPDLRVGWPKLTRPVIFVADLRYSAPPSFLAAKCDVLPPLETRAQDLFLKRISLWKCIPSE